MKYKITMLIAQTIATAANVLIGNITGTIFGCTAMLMLWQEVRGE